MNLLTQSWMNFAAMFFRAETLAFGAKEFSGSRQYEDFLLFFDLFDSELNIFAFGLLTG